MDDNINQYSIAYTCFHDIPDGDILLDFTGCRYIMEVHKVIKKGFGFPDYYGSNLDALWDCLRDLFDEERKVIIKGTHDFASIRPEHAMAFEDIFQVFDRVHQEEPWVTFEYPEIDRQ